MQTEDQLERQCLEWFRETGWDVAHGPDISPGGHAGERGDYRGTNFNKFPDSGMLESGMDLFSKNLFL